MEKTTIQLTDTFSMSRDKYQWLLHQLQPKGKHPVTGEVGTKDTFITTYHSNPEQILNVVINRSLGNCESLEEMRDMLIESRKLISETFSKLSKTNG